MKAITARFGLLFIALLVSAPSVLAAASANTKITCEQMGDIALKAMYKRQAAEQMESTGSSVVSNMSWEDKILTAGISLRANDVSISNSPDDKLESIIKFGESIYKDCKSGNLGLMQQYVENEPIIKNNTSASIEDGITKLDERVYLLEAGLASVNSFRQDTNRSLDQLRSQIRALAYGE